MTEDQEKAELAAFLRLPEPAGILLSMLPHAVRIYEQVPQSERSFLTLIEILDQLLSPAAQPETQEPRIVELLVEYQPDIQAMLRLLRNAEKMPTLALLDPSQGPHH